MKKLIIGNLKMNSTPSEFKSYAMTIATKTKGTKNTIVICPPFTHLSVAKEILSGSKVEYGAQNISEEESGALTGEISAKMIKDLGADYVIVGHSERRQKFKETDKTINKKIKTALANGLKVVLCVGETLQTRTNKQACTFVRKQIDDDLKGIYENELESVVIAYEPIWAIGTGKTATKEDANNSIKAIRNKIVEIYGQMVADEVIIQYGGSVKSTNAKELFEMSDIDGGLVGGASLKAEEFSKIVLV